METFIIYQLKVAALVAVMVLLYRLFLEKQTFHRFNRVMLILIAVLSVTLPAVHIRSLRIDTPPRTAQTDVISPVVPHRFVPDSIPARVTQVTSDAIAVTDDINEPEKSELLEQLPQEEKHTPVWVILLITVYSVGLHSICHD